MKTHLTLCLQDWNADASHTQNLAKLAWLRRPRLCFSFGELFASTLWRGLRHGYVSPSLCSFRSLPDRDALPYFDRIELRRRSRRKDDFESLRPGLEKITKSLRDLVLNDRRLIGMENGKEKVSEELDSITTYVRLNTGVANDVTGLDSFVTMLKRLVGNMYKHAGLQDVAEDHLVRIFPPQDEINL